MIQGFDIKTIDDQLIVDKKIILRVDFNLPRDKNGIITDNSRIRAVLPTIEYLLKNNNKLIIVTYLGRPKKRDSNYSLNAIAQELKAFLSNYDVVLVDDFLHDDTYLKNQKTSEIMLIENIRFYPEEKKNNLEFAKRLSQYGNIYVADAFAQMHRSEASIVSIPKLIPAYAGLLLKKEIEMLSKITANPIKPLTAVLGGAKISTKIGLISSLMKIADYILVGGGIANTFLAAKGYAVGKSLIENDAIDIAKKMLSEFNNSGCRLLLPIDAVCGDLQNPSITPELHDTPNIPQNLSILDIGPKTEIDFDQAIKNSKTIVWNGPVGLFENELYRHGTDSVYKSIVSNTDATTIVGGGDTLAAIANKKNNSKITHISTGGGAMLEFIEKGTLPGIEVLRLHSS